MSDRSSSRDRAGSPTPKHQHSSSELGRLHVPMWDSSDPDRAPPPLPLNPTSNNASPTRPNTSATVAAAAQALADRARENAGPSPYVRNALEQNDRSPERSPTRTPQHKRLQSLQNPSLRDFKASLENNKASEFSNSRSATPSRDYFSPSPERSPSRAETPTPIHGKDMLKDTPSLRPSSRAGPRNILGENTPPSATMLAIQNMPRRDGESTPLATPLADISNNSFQTVRTPDGMGNLYSQIQNLTSIATVLQKEMASLSRRSKDNATDLVSLKEATKSRDEDIRKSLRELVSNARAAEVGLLSPRGDMSRSTSAMDFTPRFLDIKPHGSPPFGKSVSLPRIPSIDEQDRAASPSPYSVEGASTMSMLEKIIREMVTKEGQERLLSTLSELLQKSGKESAETAKKVEELVQFIREKSSSQAMVKHRDSRDFSEEPPTPPDEKVLSRNRSGPGGLAMPVPVPSPQDVNIVSEDLKQYLKKLKESVSQGGGLTNEVKGLVRDLRGEVLGMGRELGKRLDSIKQPSDSDRAMVLADPDSEQHEQLRQTIQQGLDELKEQMEEVIQTKRRQSAGSALSRRSIEGQDVYALVKQSLEEQGLEPSRAVAGPAPEVDYEKIMSAVNTAFDEHPFEPEVKIEYLGLDRDEILECLKQGLEDHQANRELPESAPLAKEEIHEAVQEAMQHFSPPASMSYFAELKEELMLAVKDSLDELKQQAPRPSSRQRASEISRDDILEAVREGLGHFKKEGAREIDINRDDLFEAVKTGLDNLGYGDEVLQSLHDIVERMRVEFKEYSAANGRDTELVLDATKDGLENLRANIEAYVDRSKDVLGKEEVLEELKSGLSSLQASIESFASQTSRSGDTVAQRAELVDYIKSEFEHLHDTLGEQGRSRSLDEGPMQKEQIVAALTAGIAELKAGLGDREFEGPTEEVLDAMKDEFEQLREAILSGTAANKDELLEAIQESIGNLASQNNERAIDGGSGEGMIQAMKDEFETLRASLQAPVLHPGPSTNASEIVEALQESLDNIRVQLSADRTEAAEETLGMLRGELESIRESLNNQVVPAASPDDRVVILEAIQESINELKNSGLGVGAGDNADSINIAREELEALRASITSAVVPGGAETNSGELLDGMRSGFEEMRGRLDILSDRHHEAADSHGDISKDLLNTLKEGIESLRSQIGEIKTGASLNSDRGVVLAEGEDASKDLPAEKVTASAIAKEDLERLEVALTRLHIKVEAMDQNIQATTPIQGASSLDATSKEAINNITAMLDDLQNSMAALRDREVPQAAATAGAVSKDDTDALETLLQNTKAKIDDQVIPSLGEAATRDHLETVEAVVRLMSESVDGLSSKFNDNLASKDDVAAVYGLLEQASTSIKEVQESQAASKEQATPDLVSKGDIDTLGEVCKDIQSTVDDLPTAEELPTKSDFEELNTLVKDFKEIHDAFKQQYETDLEITAQAFDDRKVEATKIMEQIAEVKEVVAASKDELKSRMRRSNEDVRALDEILQTIEDKIDEKPDAVAEVQEVLEIVKKEFEQSHANTEGLKTGHEQHFEALNKKHDEVRSAIVGELVKMLDERFGSVIDRQDTQQKAVEEAAKAIHDKGAQQDELLSGSKAMAEDLKLTIDTLGSSVTEIGPALKEAVEKMGDDSKTVFNKVDDIHGRLDTNHVDLMTQHELTRQDVGKSIAGLTSLHDDFSTFHPRAMETLTTLLALAGEHFEHSKQATTQPREAPMADTASIHESIKTGFASLEMPRLEATPSYAPVAQDVYDDTVVRSKLDQILRNEGTISSEVKAKLDKVIETGKFDDAGRLEQLICHAEETNKHAVNFAKLDEINDQLKATAADVSAFIAFQTRSLTEAQEDKQQEARRAAADVERYNMQKQDLELTVSELTETKTNLSASIEALQAEREAIAAQKSRMAADLSSIETALRIRREELHLMDARADALERRIIDGVMDHSRALLLTKQPRAPVNMNLKRVSSTASNSTAVAPPPSATSSAMNLALKKKSGGVKKSNTVSHPDRRIHSLSQISGNSPARAPIASVAPQPKGLANLKRSQSVRNPAPRKASWTGRESLTSVDKENTDTVSDEEDDPDDATVSDHRSISQPSRPQTSLTDRTSSYSGTHVSSSDRRTSYGTGPSGSEYSYGTGSYLTGSDLSSHTSDRRTSYGSTIRSVVGGGTSLDDPIEEGDESELSLQHTEEPAFPNEERDTSGDHPEEVHVESYDDEQQPDEEAYEATDAVGELELASPEGKKPLAILTNDRGYDSGLGSDLPTAALSSTGGSDYFRKPLTDCT